MRRSLLAGFALLYLSSSGAFAESVCEAENDGNGFNLLVKMAAPELTAGVRFVASKSFTCVGIEVFTGKVSGQNKASLFKHDPNLDQPATSLATASWTAPQQTGWTGELLDGPVAITAGTMYWMVWNTLDGAQASVDVAMATPGQPYRLSSNGGTSWGPLLKDNDHHWKFRLYGTDSCCTGFGAVDTYGTNCPGTPGKSASWDDFTGCATPGGHFALDASGLAGAPALLLIGHGQGSAPINPGCALQIMPISPVVLSFTVPPGGAFQLPATVPPTTPVPIDIFAQILVADPAGKLGVASTKPLHVHIE